MRRLVRLVSRSGGFGITVRASWWTVRALGRTAHRLECSADPAVAAPPPPALPPSATATVMAVLRRSREGSLARSLVLQRWLATQGERRDVIIAVPVESPHVPAHAWVEGTETVPESLRELHRLPAGS